jgi:hypothetical protein
MPHLITPLCLKGVSMALPVLRLYRLALPFSTSSRAAALLALQAGVDSFTTSHQPHLTRSAGSHQLPMAGLLLIGIPLLASTLSAAAALDPLAPLRCPAGLLQRIAREYSLAFDSTRCAYIHPHRKTYCSSHTSWHCCSPHTTFHLLFITHHMAPAAHHAPHGT